MENEWTAAHIAEKGDKVRLVRPLRIWDYKDESVSWNVFKRWPVQYKTLPAGEIGVVTDRELWLNSAHYTIKFGELIVRHVHPMLFELHEEVGVTKS